MTFAERLRATRNVRLSFDEGGIRVDDREKPAGYVPYAILRDVSCELVREWLVVLEFVCTFEAVTGEVVKVTLDEKSDALAAQRSAAVELAAFKARAEVLLPPALVRGDRALDAFLLAVSSEGGGYREGSLVPAALSGLLEETRTPIEARAAAAYALICEAEGEALAMALRAFIVHAMPPLVVAAAAATPGGGALVPDDVREWLRGYLTDGERAALGRLVAVRPRSVSREDAITQALSRAKESAQAQLEAMGDGGAKRPAGALLAGTASTTAWVGRSWSL